MAKSTPEDAGRYAYDGLDRVFHEKARLGIMTSLVTRADGLVFGELKSLCNLTDGNLSRQGVFRPTKVQPWVERHSQRIRQSPDLG